jgi:hypothetical protein
LRATTVQASIPAEPAEKVPAAYFSAYHKRLEIPIELSTELTPRS